MCSKSVPLFCSLPRSKIAVVQQMQHQCCKNTKNISRKRTFTCDHKRRMTAADPTLHLHFFLPLPSHLFGVLSLSLSLKISSFCYFLFYYRLLFFAISLSLSPLSLDSECVETPPFLASCCVSAECSGSSCG